jgi:NitT/TauT family transport system substrate-binding protein
LSNLPENLAFFSGAIDAAGSFESIYQSAVLAYGSDLIKDPPDAGRFAALGALQTLEKSGLFKEQKVAIAPIRSGGGTSLESDPLLSKDIRFLFEPNSSTLDMSNQDNLRNLEAIKKLVQVSPGRRCFCAATSTTRRLRIFAGKAVKPWSARLRCARWP